MKNQFEKKLKMFSVAYLFRKMFFKNVNKNSSYTPQEMNIESFLLFKNKSMGKMFLPVSHLKGNVFYTIVFLFLFNTVFSTNYYSKATGNPSSVFTWGTNTDGTGTSPANFTTPGDIFIVRSGAALTMTSSFTIGSGVELRMIGTITIAGNNNAVSTLTINGTINFTGASSNQLILSTSSGNVNTRNNFTLSNSATLITANVNGIAGTNCSISSLSTTRVVVTLSTSATYEFNALASQATSGLPTQVASLILSGSGTKTLPSSLSVSGNLNIDGAVAGINAGSLYSVDSLTLGGLGTNSGVGSWGSTSSTATYKNNTFFAPTTGRITVATDTRATPTIAPIIGTYTYSGLQQGPNQASNSGTGSSYTFSYVGTGTTNYSSSATAPTNAGTYSVTVSLAASTDGFYKSNTSSATPFQIGAKSLTITALGSTKCQGVNNTLPTNNYTVSGLVGTESVGSVTLTSTGNPSSAAVGTYPIVAQNATGGTFLPANYNITYVDGVLNVTNDATTWNGTSWSNGDPSSTKAAVISANYTSPGITNSSYNLRTCKLNVTNNATVIISSGDSVELDGALTVDTGSSMTFNSGAYLFQNDDVNTNSGSVIIKQNTSPLKRLDYVLWSSPVTGGQTLLSFSPNTLTNRFYSYDTQNTAFVTIANPSVTTFTAAKGVLIRLPNNHPQTEQIWTGNFVGTPNNGTYTLSLETVGQQFNLVGNPYPSPIDPFAFFTDPTNAASITGTIYLFRKTNGSATPSYSTLTMGGFASNGDPRSNAFAALPDNKKLIQPGQGFFVKGKVSGSGTMVFNNAMRVNDHVDTFMRVNNITADVNGKSRIWLNVTNSAGAFSQTMIGYMANATNEYDGNYDGEYINDGEIALASLLDSTPFAVQCKGLPFDTADVIPLYFKATNAGGYTIAIDHVDGLFLEGQQVYLHDKLSATYHNLNDGAYNFVSEAGTFNERFELVYQDSALGVTNPNFTENQVIIYKTATNQLSVNTGTFVMDGVKVFDLTGRLLFEQKGINASQAYLDVPLTTEVLLVQVKTQEGKTITKKVLFLRTSLKKEAKVTPNIQIAEDE